MCVLLIRDMKKQSGTSLSLIGNTQQSKRLESEGRYYKTDVGGKIRKKKVPRAPKLSLMMGECMSITSHRVMSQS